MPATERAGRSLLRATGVAALVFVAAELAARAVHPGLPSAAADGLLRNPHYARGWPEYTQPPAPGAPPRTQPLVIAISNSQGFLRERAAADEAWPSRLAQELAAAGVSARVLNWSSPGGSGAEMTVLAARSRAHRPDLVLLVSYTDNFSDGWRRRPLSYGFSDIHHLAYLPEVRAHLPAGFLISTGAFHPLGWLGAHSSLLWLRNRWADVGESWTWTVAEPPRGALRRLAGTGTLEPLGRFTLFDDFLAASGAAAADGPALLVVGMPLCGAIYSDRAVAAAFAERAAARLAGMPRARALDATAIAPDAEFYGARHLRPRGHARFAAWLEPHVRELLAARE